MRKAFLAFLVVVFVLLNFHSAGACGDKLLAMTRSIGIYKAYVPWRTASILIYQVQSGSPLKDKQFQSSLKQAGHKVQTIDNASQLDQALSGKKYDLVLAEIGDANSLSQRLASLHANPSVLPVLHKATKNELAAAEKQYGVAMQIPAAFTEHLEAIDRMMKLRAHAS
jgi:hypothetical protein